MTTPEAGELPGAGINPLASLRAHGRIALIAFALTLLAGLPFVFVKGEPQYAATASVQVASRYMKNLKEDGELDFQSNSQYRQFVEHQSKSVLRYDILQDALARLGDRAALWKEPGEPERRSIERLHKALTVRAVPDTYIMEISIAAARKDGLAETVNAVVAAYIDRMKAELIFGAEDRVQFLKAREKALLQAIQEKTERRTAIALQLGVTGFSDKDANPYDSVIGEMRSALSDARNKRSEAEAKLQAFLAKGETDIATRSIQEAVLIDPGLNSFKSNLLKRRADLLVQLSGLKPDHPIHQEATAELKRIDSEIAGQMGALSAQVRASVLQRFETTVEQTRRIEADLAREFAALQKQGLNFANLYNQALALSREIDEERKEFDAVRDRLNFFASEKNSLGFVRLITPALPPDLPYGPGKKKLLLLVLLAALGAALALPVVLDLADRRIHTVNDAERALAIPALGWVMEQSDAATRMFAEDQLRRLAGGLLREQEVHGTHVFAFTSVKPGAGTTDLVFNLARTLDALGFPALAVEANAFSPDPRYASDRPGLSACLLSEASLQECVAPADGALPARVQVGTGERHIDRLDRLNEACAGWSRDFRFVLVDLPPLLLSADAEILARSLQHVLLVVEAGAMQKGEVKRAGRQLAKLSPAAVGVVVTRVRLFAGGGYLHGLLLEHLTGRKVADYFTRPAWLIELQLRLADWGPWRIRRLFSRKPERNPA